MSAGFSFDPTGLLQGLTQTESKADVAIRMYAEQSALKLQNYAKEHRRWTDRTGHARQRLTGSSAKITTGYRLQLAHGVDYGLWLELANEKKYAIIQETINYVGQNEILPGLERLLERLGST